MNQLPVSVKDVARPNVENITIGKRLTKVYIRY